MKKVIIVPILVLIVTAAFAQTKPRLGILPFTGGTGRDGDAIASLFANSQDLGQEFSIVPRTSSIDAVMKEQEFQRSGLTDSDTIADLGKQMNADYVVSGHIAPLGNTNLLSISIVDVKTMRQVAGDYEKYDRIEAVRDLLPPMARRIIALVRAQNTVPPDALAVLPLNIRDPDIKQENAEILAQILATEIANSRQYAVFPRTKTIETVMAEQDIQQSGMTDRASMIAIGKATNARFVLAGMITKLGTMNVFDVKILNIESGEQVEGSDRDYIDLSDGVALMGELAYELTGVETNRHVEVKREAQQDATVRQQAERKQQNTEAFRKTVNRLIRGDNGKKFTGIGINAGIGLGNEEYLDLNGFANINLTIPLYWSLFAEGGVDIGVIGTGKQEDNPSRENEKDTYQAYRVYGRLNIGFPLGTANFLFLPYAGVGYSYTNATCEFEFEEHLVKKSLTKNYEYAGVDMAFGFITSGRHHSIRLGANLHSIFRSEYFELQLTLGYAYRF